MRLLLLMLGISVYVVPIGTRADAQISLVRDLQRGSGWRRHELRFHNL
jgi:hypothetical protein